MNKLYKLGRVFLFLPFLLMCLHNYAHVGILSVAKMNSFPIFAPIGKHLSGADKRNSIKLPQIIARQITGTVSDTVGILPGVSVRVKGTNTGVSTGSNGKFILDVPDGNVIVVFSMVGYITQEIQVNGRSIINVTLKVSLNSLDDIAVVAFGTQKKSSMVSSVTTINPSELKTPSSNLTNSLAGRVAGVIAYQRGGEPGMDNADFFIRGVSTFGYSKSPLILIDGVETTATEFARIQPDDVASFSIMKDASATSLYGARGANGVMIITTKTGKEGKMSVSARFEDSFSTNTKDVELADPVTYMRLENESILTRNPNSPLPYTQNQIDNTAKGLNPYIYPANDWQKMLLKDYTNNQRLNVSFSGGGKVSKYYVTGSVNQDNGILKVDKRNNFNSNINLKSYQLRSNINLNLTSTTEAVVRFAGSFDDYNGPIDGGAGLYSKIMRANPVQFPAYFPASLMPGVNHILFGNYRGSDNGAIGLNPYADMVKGYKDYSKSQMSAQFEVKQDLAFFVKGMSARGLFNTARYSYFDISRYYNPYFYSPGIYDKLTDTYNLNLLNEGSATEYLGYNEGKRDINTTLYLETALDYARTFDKKHDVSGLLVYTRRQQLFSGQGTLQKSLPYRNQGVSGRFSYAYDTRFLAEVSFGYNGSERFAKSQRFGFFPAAGLGWYISNENFWKPLKNVVNKFKLRATYGLVGNDAIGSADDRFFYLSEVTLNDPNKYSEFGENYGYRRNGVTISRYANPDISWETSRKLNLGLDLGLFNAFDIQLDYFTDQRSGILMTRSAIPTTEGLSAPVKANIGKAKSNGVDFSVNYNKYFNKNFWMAGRGNFTYAHNEYVAYEEPAYKEQYLSHIGQSINGMYGYLAERLFIDQEDANNSPRQNFGEYGAGDIKYRDVNGDGQITSLDAVPIGLPTSPEIVYGFGFSTGYKKFDFSAFFQGVARESFMINATATAPFPNQLLKAYADDHWSEDNQNSYALWPRLSDKQNSNNLVSSTWFLRNGAFLRLKQVEFGYSLPQSLIQRIAVRNLRIYANGTNLFLLSKFKLWDVEMGSNGLGYPIQKVFNLGIQVSL